MRSSGNKKRRLGPGVCEICHKSSNHLLIRPQGLRYHESCMRAFKKKLYTTS